jgi:hypothetical protein
LIKNIFLPDLVVNSVVSTAVHAFDCRSDRNNNFICNLSSIDKSSRDLIDIDEAINDDPVSFLPPPPAHLTSEDHSAASLLDAQGYWLLRGLVSRYELLPMHVFMYMYVNLCKCMNVFNIIIINIIA